MLKKTINIKGMHCKACEMLVEEEIGKIKGVKNVNANNVKGQAEIYSSQPVNDTAIAQAVRNAGYQIGENGSEIISKNNRDYFYLLIFFAVTASVVYFLSQKKILNFSFTNNSNYGSLLVVMLIGLTAGFSTCMALVGGIVLSLSAKFIQNHPGLSPSEKLQPQIYFNLGRIIGFFILGGVIGYFGSILQLSNNLLGGITVGVGLIMFLLGVQLLGIFPQLNKINIAFPKFISRFILKKENDQDNGLPVLLLGGLTFFLPCSFTQAVQLYAITSGSVERGAMTMAAFAIGTTPGLLGIGSLTSIIKQNWTKRFFMLVGVIIIFMAVFNIKNGLNLTDINLYEKNKINSKSETKEGFQIIKMTQTASGYSPDVFDLVKGQPVRWIIDSQNANSCSASIFVPKLGIRKFLQPGENIIEFTPNEAGEIKFTCSMGMYVGYLNVK